MLIIITFKINSIKPNNTNVAISFMIDVHAFDKNNFSLSLSSLSTSLPLFLYLRRKWISSTNMAMRKPRPGVGQGRNQTIVCFGRECYTPGHWPDSLLGHRAASWKLEKNLNTVTPLLYSVLESRRKLIG